MAPKKAAQPKKARDVFPAAAPPAADTVDAAFPRGGADGLTPLERKQIEAEAKAALDQEAAAGAGAVGVKRKRSATAKPKAQVRYAALRCATLGTQLPARPPQQPQLYSTGEAVAQLCRGLFAALQSNAVPTVAPHRMMKTMQTVTS